MLETEMGHQTMINNGLIKTVRISPETIVMVKETGKVPSSLKSYGFLIRAVLNNR